ncbi:MAG TPA: phosphoribosyl-ATP diphosphatase [Bradyrhizobium sp.]|jgi:phosphoribosyl-ATP pyrophosphohydrolase|nr:phosphoribosyl-ATP diphosphatase [Bradyrhizobium sp.]
MGDSIERLYQAVLAARDLDPATSRTARLFQRGPAKMAKKLAEEAIEVVIDSVSGDTQAVVRESADLLYNLTVLWASAGVRPEDIWLEMERRELLLGIAEKMPKSAVKLAKTVAQRPGRRPIVALDRNRLRKRH